MNHRDTVAPSGFPDAEWDRRVQYAASADVWRLLRDMRRRRRRRWLMLAVGLLAVALTATLLGRIGAFDGVLPAGDAPPAESAPASLTSTVTPTADQRGPFAASPAAGWPDGAAGLVAAEAAAVNGFTADQVRAALDQVRDILVSSRLDRRLVVDHDPSAFLAALAPDARRQLGPLFGSGREVEVQSLVSMVDRGHALPPVEPKVKGRMWAGASGPGELVVHTNYVFAYAFVTATKPAGGMADPLVVVRADVDYVLRTGPRWTRDSRGWWYGKADGYAYSIACDSYARGFLAPAVTEDATTLAPRVDRGAYFDPSGPLPALSGCPR